MAKYMLTHEMDWTRQWRRDAANHWMLTAMDSVVAEYTLIQMAGRAGDEYVLRWTDNSSELIH